MGRDKLPEPGRGGRDALDYGSRSTHYEGDPEHAGNMPNAKLSGDAEDYRTGQFTPGEPPGNGLRGETQVEQFTGKGQNKSSEGSGGGKRGPSQKLYANTASNNRPGKTTVRGGG